MVSEIYFSQQTGCYALHSVSGSGNRILDRIYDTAAVRAAPKKILRKIYDDACDPVSALKEYGNREGETSGDFSCIHRFLRDEIAGEKADTYCVPPEHTAAADEYGLLPEWCDFDIANIDRLPQSCVPEELRQNSLASYIGKRCPYDIRLVPKSVRQPGSVFLETVIRYSPQETAGWLSMLPGAMNEKDYETAAASGMDLGTVPKMYLTERICLAAVSHDPEGNWFRKLPEEYSNRNFFLKAFSMADRAGGKRAGEIAENIWRYCGRQKFCTADFVRRAAAAGKACHDTCPFRDFAFVDYKSAAEYSCGRGR